MRFAFILPLVLTVRMVLAVQSAPEVVIVPQKARELFGDKAARMVVGIRFKEDKKEIQSLFLIDFAAPSTPPQFVMSGSVARISSDGTRLAFTAGQKTAVARLEKNSTSKVDLDYGAQPTWWVDPKTSDEFLIFTSQNMTLIRPIKKGGCEEGGPLRILIPDLAAGAGRSPDGRFICGGRSASDNAKLVELEPANALRDATAKVVYGVHAGASISPVSASAGMLAGRRYEEAVYIKTGPKNDQVENITLPAPYNRVIHVLWSQPDFLTAILASQPKGSTTPEAQDTFVYQLSTRKWVQICKGGVFADLWVSK